MQVPKGGPYTLALKQEAPGRLQRCRSTLHGATQRTTRWAKRPAGQSGLKTGREKQVKTRQWRRDEGGHSEDQGQNYSPLYKAGTEAAHPTPTWVFTKTVPELILLCYPLNTRSSANTLLKAGCFYNCVMNT